MKLRDSIRFRAGLSTIVLLVLFSVSCRTVPIAERPARSVRPHNDQGRTGTLRQGQAVVRAVRGQAEVAYRGDLKPAPEARPNLTGFRVGYAVVRAVRGHAEYSQSGDRWQKLAVGHILQAGAGVRTSSESSVDLFLKKNGPFVRVLAESELRLDQLSFRPGKEPLALVTVLEVPRGRVLAVVRKLTPGSVYEIRTKKGVTRVRGTMLGVSHAGQVTVSAGTVEFVISTARFEISAGQTFDPAAMVVRPATSRELSLLSDLPGVQTFGGKPGSP